MTDEFYILSKEEILQSELDYIKQIFDRDPTSNEIQRFLSCHGKVTLRKGPHFLDNYSKTRSCLTSAYTLYRYGLTIRKVYKLGYWAASVFFV